MESGSHDGRAISPVVGVVLMVAIVILLALSIGVMALSFSEDLPDRTDIFLEDHCPGFHIATYEPGKFNEFADMVSRNNCALWLQHGEVETAVGDTVVLWRDQGPHSFHAHQPFIDDRPALTDDGISDVLGFEADQPVGDPQENSGQYMWIERNVDDLNLDPDAGVVVAAVLKANEFDRNGVWTIGEAGIAPGSEFSLRTCSSRAVDGCPTPSDPEGEWRAQHWDAADLDFSSGSGSEGEWIILVHGYDGEDVFVRVNGEEVARQGANLDLSLNRDIQIGRWDRMGEYWYYDGAIAEILIFDQSLTDSETELLETYLSEEHNIDLDGPIEE